MLSNNFLLRNVRFYCLQALAISIHSIWFNPLRSDSMNSVRFNSVRVNAFGPIQIWIIPIFCFRFNPIGPVQSIRSDSIRFISVQNPKQCIRSDSIRFNSVQNPIQCIGSDSIQTFESGNFHVQISSFGFRATFLNPFGSVTGPIGTVLNFLGNPRIKKSTFIFKQF